MALDFVLTAVQYLWQVHYIKLTLQYRLRMQCDLWEDLIATALQYSARFSRVRWVYFLFVVYSFWAMANLLVCRCVVASSYHEFVIDSFYCPSSSYNHPLK